MALRRPLVLVSGSVNELSPNDRLDGEPFSSAVLTAGSGLSGGGVLADNVRLDINLANSPSGLLFVGDSLGLDGTAQTALASGNSALIVGSSALASGNAALSSASSAQASGNIALSSGLAALALANSAQASGNAALSTKLSLTGGTMLGAVTASGGTESSPGISFGSAGVYSTSSTSVSLAANNQQRVTASSTEVVVNDGGADVDFRVEGDTDSSLIYVDAGVDRVGFGTNSPQQKVDINGNLCFNGEGTSYFYRPSANLLGAVVNGTDILRASSTRVGVNTTDPKATFHVNGVSTDGTTLVFPRTYSASDNVQTNFLTLQVPSFNGFTQETNYGLFITYAVKMGRSTSSRTNSTWTGSIYGSIARFWESSANSPVYFNFNHQLTSSGNVNNPPITWSGGVEAGIDQSAKYIYLNFTINNPSTSLIYQDMSAKVELMNVFSSSLITVSGLSY
jgi:hypothetical protein